MEGSLARTAIAQAARSGIRHIVFNGGEPFLHANALGPLIRQACEQGIRCTVMTSGSWAVSPRRARQHLGDLKACGLHAVTLSTDRFHLPFVPLHRVRTALAEAERAGIRTGVKIARLPWDPVADGLFRALRGSTRRIVVQQVAPLGRASSLRTSLPLRTVFHLARPACPTPPVLLPDGRLLACCNLPANDLTADADPFLLGDLHRAPLADLIVRRSRDPLLHFLRDEGPQGLYVPLLAAAPADSLLLPCFYHDGCDLCFHLFRQGWARTAAYACLTELHALKRAAARRPAAFSIADGRAAAAREIPATTRSVEPLEGVP